MNWKAIFLPIYLLTLSVCLSVAEAHSPTTLKVNTSIKPPFSTQDQTGFFDVILKEIGKRIGCEVELVRLPPARALLSADQGVSDAELPRIAGLEHKYPNLVPVEEKLIDYSFVAFMRGQENRHVKCWNDLKQKRVGYLVGWKIFEKNVKQAHITKLNKPSLLFEMLDKGRIDVALYERYAGRNIIRSYGHMGLDECAMPLAVMPMYMYFHKTHASLAPQVSQVLREMKADGTYARIMEQTLGK